MDGIKELNRINKLLNLMLNESCNINEAEAIRQKLIILNKKEKIEINKIKNNNCKCYYYQMEIIRLTNKINNLIFLLEQEEKKERGIPFWLVILLIFTTIVIMSIKFV